MKEMLLESYRAVKKASGIDPSKPGNLKHILVDDNAFNVYVESLAESLPDKRDKENFRLLAENTRVSLLENSMYQINPYESLTMPILRVFYPKLIAKETVTVSPMDKPECVKSFIKATFAPANSTSYSNAPVMSPDISSGPGVGTPISVPVAVPTTTPFDVLDAIDLDKTQAHLERDFVITAVSSDGTHWSAANVVPAVEGHFSGSVSIGAHTDVISGFVDYLNGTLVCSSATSLVSDIKFEVTCSLEENRINPKLNMTVEKIRLYARDRQIQANWTINMEQDMRALFDVSIQAEIVNLLAQQIALDIDREIINALIVANTKLNPANHQLSFTKDPPSDYSWGPKYWHENIIPKLNVLSARVYTDTNIDETNVIACNPLDAAILEDLNSFAYTGTAAVNGEAGYRSATVAGSKWKVLTSPVVPEGKMVMVYKPDDEIRSIFFYSPYVPSVLHPFPLTYTPSLTILSRYATALVRERGIAVLNIV